MRIKDFYALVDLEREPDVSMQNSLHKLVDRYPLFQAGIFIYIKCLYLSDAPNYVTELNRLTPFVHDRKALFYYVFNDVYERFHSKQASQKVMDRTNMLINAFFETNNDKMDGSEVDQLAYAIQNTSMASLDYLSYIGLSQDSPETDYYEPVAASVGGFEHHSDSSKMMKGQDIIDRFIAKSETLETPILPVGGKGNTESSAPLDKNRRYEDDDDSEDDFFFTHALVDIYIKQKKYVRAYEIIKRLSLNYPEKNIYFADQLKYLEKHIKSIE